MFEVFAKCAASYLLGSLMGGLIVGRIRGGVDIRKLGSGNAGGTNALRTQGRSFALWVTLIDIGKGALAATVIADLPVPGIASAQAAWQEWLAPLCGLAAVVGHIYPIWFGFRGGKGVATLVGALFGINAWLLLWVLLTWLAVVVLSGYVSLGSILAAFAIPVFVLWSGQEPLGPLLVFGICVAALVLFTHRSNIARLRAAMEPRARSLWLLGRGRD